MHVLPCTQILMTTTVSHQDRMTTTVSQQDQRGFNSSILALTYHVSICFAVLLVISLRSVEA